MFLRYCGSLKTSTTIDTMMPIFVCAIGSGAKCVITSPALSGQVAGEIDGHEIPISYQSSFWKVLEPSHRS